VVREELDFMEDTVHEKVDLGEDQGTHGNEEQVQE
jgi:hypothetical protein